MRTYIVLILVNPKEVYLDQYLLFNSELPTTKLTAVSTFAAITEILTSHHNPEIASMYLQINLNKIMAEKWIIKANETNSLHVTFTLKRDQCLPVNLNNC